MLRYSNLGLDVHHAKSVGAYSMVIYLVVHFSFFRIYPDCSFGHFSRLYEFKIGNKSKEQSLQDLRKFSKVFLEGINKRVKICLVSPLF